MTPRLRQHFDTEMQSAARSVAAGDTAAAWLALERAHILSQAHAGPHVRVHWEMLVLGWRRLDAREVLGQVTRMLVAAPGSWLGKAPLGNTGRARVGILTPMPIAEDLRRMLEP
jgi:Protein of unknown function (DUF3703)